MRDFFSWSGYCILTVMKILITGAMGGIGSELVKFLSRDNQVIAVGRRVESVKNKKVDYLSVDVASRLEVAKMFAKIDSLDVLINCAAILGPVSLFGESDLKLWEDTIRVNLMGTVYTSYYALPLLLKARRGKIINFSGGGSAAARIFHSAYGSSKTAVVRFSETVAAEYPDLDINAIAPGAYKTNIWAGETHDKEPDVWGDMDRLKMFIGFMCSEKSDGISGKFIHYKDNWESFSWKDLENGMFTLRRVEK